jgi:hypothetical protein
MASLLDYTSLHLIVYTASLLKVYLRKAVLHGNKLKVQPSGYAYRSVSVDIEEYSECTNVRYFANADVSRHIELEVYVEGISVK